MKCKNCGAEVENRVCKYCGTIYESLLPPPQYNKEQFLDMVWKIPIVSDKDSWIVKVVTRTNETL